MIGRGLPSVWAIVVAKKSKHGPATSFGAWCGMPLGTSAGIAGFAAVPLATAANRLGNTIYGTL